MNWSRDGVQQQLMLRACARGVRWFGSVQEFSAAEVASAHKYVEETLRSRTWVSYMLASYLPQAVRTPYYAIHLFDMELTKISENARDPALGQAQLLARVPAPHLRRRTPAARAPLHQPPPRRPPPPPHQRLLPPHDQRPRRRDSQPEHRDDGGDAADGGRLEGDGDRADAGAAAGGGGGRAHAGGDRLPGPGNRHLRVPAPRALLAPQQPLPPPRRPPHQVQPHRQEHLGPRLRQTLRGTLRRRPRGSRLRAPRLLRGRPHLPGTPRLLPRARLPRVPAGRGDRVLPGEPGEVQLQPLRPKPQQLQPRQAPLPRLPRRQGQAVLHRPAPGRPGPKIVISLYRHSRQSGPLPLPGPAREDRREEWGGGVGR